MADDNPFANALRPEKGGLPGFIGGMMGVPTTQESQGSATGQALSELSVLRDQGLPPQQALIKFLQTPSGQDYFAHAGPDGMKQLTDGLAATQPPAPTMHNVAPGGQLYQQDNVSGKTSLVGNNPQTFAPTKLSPGEQAIDRQGNTLATNENPPPDPADVQSFKFYAQFSGLPKAELQRLAGLKMDPTADKTSVESQAIDKLVSDYGLPTETGEKLKSGQLKIVPLKNEVGQDTGAVSLIDMTNPNGPTVQVINPGGKGPAATTGTSIPGVTPAVPPVAGTSPTTGSATGTLPPVSTDVSTPAKTIPENNPAYFGKKSSMFLGSGAIASGLAGASSVSEQINPKMIIPEGAQAADRQVMIDTLRSDLAAMGQLGGGIGVNKGVLEGYMKLAPTGSAMESPHQAIQKAIRLSEHIDQEITAEQQTYANAKLPIEDRKAAAARIQGWQRVQRDLPSNDELASMEKSIREGTAGAATVSGAVNTIAGAAGRALTEVKKQGSEVAKAQGIGDNQVDIDGISDPKALAAIDPRTLDRAGKIKYMRKVDQFTKGVKK